jgi:glycosyltransferase involved in cell wall biosynthesis
MKICRVTKYLPGNHRHPGVQHAYYLTQNIRQPTLIIAKKDGARTGYPLPDHAVLKEIAYGDFALTGASSGRNVISGGSTRFGQKWQFLLKLALKSREILFLVKAIPALMRFRPRVLHSHGLMTLVHGLFAKLFLRSRVVITIHSAAETLLVNRLRLLRYALDCCDKIICVSNAVRQNLAPHFAADKLEVIPTGFDPQLFGNLRLERKNQLVAVGYLKWQKDYSCMIEAMAQVAARLPGYRLLIIGDGPERQKLEREIERFQLADKVRLLGNLGQSEIVEHLNESKLFIMSSVSEGLPKALLEAAACGTPAVVTTACNAEDFIDRIGIAVDPGDSRVLAAAIHELLADPARWQRLSTNSVAVAQRYRWDSISAETMDLYNRLCSAAG